jgi:hypothetical protein
MQSADVFSLHLPPLFLFVESTEGYFELIKKPMDLSTIQEKLNRGEYDNGLSFLKVTDCLANSFLVFHDPA